jgi:MtN3 and saliva related transmembrane protein
MLFKDIPTSQIFAYIGLFISIVINIPQLIKIVQTKNVNDISMITYVLVIIANICFTVRSVDIHETPITISNIIKSVVSLAILIFYYKYRKK